MTSGARQIHNQWSLAHHLDGDAAPFPESVPTRAEPCFACNLRRLLRLEMLLCSPHHDLARRQAALEQVVDLDQSLDTCAYCCAMLNSAQESNVDLW